MNDGDLEQGTVQCDNDPIAGVDPSGYLLFPDLLGHPMVHSA